MSDPPVVDVKTWQRCWPGGFGASGEFFNGGSIWDFHSISKGCWVWGKVYFSHYLTIDI